MSEKNMFRQLAAVAVLLALQACAGNTPAPKNPATARLGAGGVSPAALSLQPFERLVFVNADGRRHQIYSNDCNELSSAPLESGQGHAAAVGFGPKVCHYQDLLAPSAEQYWGTVTVEESPRLYSDSFVP